MSGSGDDAKVSLASLWTDLPREGRLLLSVVVVEFVGTGLVLPFWVVYLHEVRRLPLDTVGVLMGVVPLAGFLAAILGGGAIDRFGPRRVMVCCVLTSITGEIVVPFATTVAPLAVGLALNGVAWGVAWPTHQSFVAAVIPSRLRASFFGLNFSLLNLGIGVGGIIGGFLTDVRDLTSFQALYLLDAASFLPGLVLLLVPLRHVGGPVARDQQDRAEAPAPPGGYLDVLRAPAMRWVVAIMFVSSLVGYGQLNSGFPAFARVVSRASTRDLGFAFAANTFVIVVMQLVVLTRLQGRRRTRVIAVMSGVWALCWTCLGASGLVPGTLGGAILVAGCAGIFGLGETLLQPTLPAIVNDLAPDRLRGRYNALTAAVLQAASIVAPVVAGVLLGHGGAGLFIALLLAGCALTAVLALRMERVMPARANGLLDDGPGVVSVAPPASGPVPTPPVPPEARV